MNKISILFLIILLTKVLDVRSQEAIDLYNGIIPNSIENTVLKEHVLPSTDGIVRVTGVSKPMLYAYFPEKELNTGKAVIICPGGGYEILAINKEGSDVAKRFAAVGITAFVLKYRLPKDEIVTNKSIVPLQDAQRAIQLVRENAKEWKIEPDEIGIVGFSAGGHVASTLGTHYQKAVIDNKLNISLRPDFMLLLYPVISMESGLTHHGSKTNLLGNDPSEEQIVNFSNDQRVTDDTPPTFLVHAADDNVVSIANSESFRNVLKEHHVRVEMLRYPEGGHGFGLNNPTTKDQWFGHFLEWLKEQE